MSIAQWSSVLDQDLIFRLYLDDHRPSMLLFVEVAQTMGIALTFDPLPAQDVILRIHGTLFANDAMIHLSQVQQRLHAVIDSQRSVGEVLDEAVSIALDDVEPDGSRHTCLLA